MKKQLLLLMAILALSMTNCKKDHSSDDNGDGDDQNVAKPVPVTTTQNDNSSPIFNLTEVIINQISGEQSKNVATTTTVSNFEYDGRHITKVTSNNGTDVSVKEYHYADMANGILDSIVYKQNGQLNAVDRYQMSNGHIQEIATYDANNTLQQRITVSGYNGDHPSQMSIYAVTAQGPMDLSGTITYTGDDMTSISMNGTWSGYNVSLADTFSYDTKNNVFLNVETLELPYGTVHNSASVNAQLSINGSVISNETTTFTYTYDSNDFPITGTYSTSSANGTMEYVYEDK